MSAPHLTAAPYTSDLEARLRSVEESIRVKEAEELQEAERRRIEDERRARWEAAGFQGHTLAALKQMALELRAEIEQRQAHVQGEAQQELDRQRAARLNAEVLDLRTRLATAEAALEGPLRSLFSCTHSSGDNGIS